MDKQFNVTIRAKTASGKVLKFNDTVAVVPGRDIFDVAREVAAERFRRAKKGAVVRFFPAVAVAA